MHISVRGKQLDVGAALRSHAENRLGDAVGKYFGNPIEATVTFSREGAQLCADCSVHVGHGIQVQAHGAGGDAYGALDGAIDRLEKRLRRYKRRLRDHNSRQNQAGPALIEAQSYVLAAEPEELPEDTPGDSKEAEQADGEPVIIAETTTQIPTCTVGDAVMRLELSGAPVQMFRNAGSDRLNLVYRRTDGNIGWIDPAGGDA